MEDLAIEAAMSSTYTVPPSMSIVEVTKMSISRRPSKMVLGRKSRLVLVQGFLNLVY